MPVKVRCTNCDKVLNAPDAAKGKAIKCPACETRIAVPADDDSSSSVGKTPSKKKTSDSDGKKKKATKHVDSEDALASFDLNKLEDKDARICFKCGYDMQYEDEDTSECPKCGYDSSTGGLGKKAQKKRMIGPDPADFYPGLMKDAWSFVLKNHGLVWRTNLYVGVCLLLSLLVGFLFLLVPPLPPRVFFTLCFMTAFMVIPGWMWHFSTEVIKLTLERKDKFKKVLFDFFLCSATGLMSIAWLCLVGVPLMAIPVGVGYYLWKTGGENPLMLGAGIGVGIIPVLWMLPVGMAHMTMPVTMPGWMVWKIIPAWGRTIKALTVWLLLLLMTLTPLIGGAAAIGAVWGNDISSIVQTMEANAATYRERAAAANAPKGKNAPAVADPNTIGTINDVDYKPLIFPGVILALMVLPVGYIALFNMRVMGQYIYYHKPFLGLTDKAKEYKYVARIRKGEDGEEIIDTSGKDINLGVVVCLIGAGIVGYGIYDKFIKAVPEGTPVPTGAYAAGQWAGIGFGALLLIAGIASIIKGMNAKNRSQSGPVEGEQ